MGCFFEGFGGKEVRKCVVRFEGGGDAEGACDEEGFFGSVGGGDLPGCWWWGGGVEVAVGVEAGEVREGEGEAGEVREGEGGAAEGRGEVHGWGWRAPLAGGRWGRVGGAREGGGKCKGAGW